MNEVEYSELIISTESLTTDLITCKNLTKGTELIIVIKILKLEYQGHIIWFALKILQVNTHAGEVLWKRSLGIAWLYNPERVVQLIDKSSIHGRL